MTAKDFAILFGCAVLAFGIIGAFMAYGNLPTHP